MDIIDKSKITAVHPTAEIKESYFPAPNRAYVIINIPIESEVFCGSKKLTYDSWQFMLGGINDFRGREDEILMAMEGGIPFSKGKFFGKADLRSKV